jgi:hypothetical protein
MISKQKIKYITNNKIKKNLVLQILCFFVQIKNPFKQTSKQKYNSLNKNRERFMNIVFP